MQKGTIGVTTENIFPIIKKFLYSDHEIFLRELVSNAVDATQKFIALSRTGEFKGETGELKVTVTADPKKGTLTISDSGIGMTEEEVQKYINQIAFSSAGEFLEKYKDHLNGIIGHFGLGFYSSFMVSKKVEIETLSWREGAVPVNWSCEGDPNYTIKKGKRKKRGTDIILHLDDESKEYAESGKINSLLNKYCKFLPVEVWFEDKAINDTTPLWTKKPADLKEEEYTEFYNKLYPLQEEPLFHIHLNVDYPFTLTGVLYFPKIKDSVEVSRNKIQLYSNQVFVTDSVENIVPDFLTLLHGVIDSPDIPLNVSRSYLQSDPNVKKISSHITKKVADRLEELFKNDRAKLEEKWDNLKLFIEYGMLSDEKFFERAEKFALLKNFDNKYFSFEEYKKLIEGEQKNKDNKLVYLYATDKEQQYTHIESAKKRGYDVLIMDSQLDSHFVNLLESKFTDSQFVRVDSDHINKLIQKEESAKVELSKDQIEDLSTAFESVMPKDAHYSVSIERLGEEESPILITQSEFMRRYRDMSALSGGLNFYGSLPQSYNIIVNYDNKLAASIIEEINSAELPPVEIIKTKEGEEGKEQESVDSTKRKEAIKELALAHSKLNQICDLALLSNGMLKGQELDNFVKRSFELIK